MGDVWKGFRIGDGAESFKARTVDEKEQCRVCWAKYLCGGGCVADAYEITGSFDEVDVVHCEFTKAVAENALIIFHAISSSGVDAPTESPLREDIGCHPTSP
jgi:uncharacterized protein